MSKSTDLFRLLILCALAFLITSAVKAQTTPKPDSSDMRERMTKDLNAIAMDLSTALADPKVRSGLAEAIKGSTNREQRLVLSHYLASHGEAAAEPRAALRRAARQTATFSSMLAQHGKGDYFIDAYFPVDAHREALARAERIFVLPAPIGDEMEQKSLAGYANGQRQNLNGDKAPDVPTLVIGIAEPSTLDPPYPVRAFKEVSDDEIAPNPELPANKPEDDQVGLPYVRILDDNEPWYKGDPEIYVKITRVRFAPFGVVVNNVNLPGVNDTGVWYSLGDPEFGGGNSTYRFVSVNNYAPVIQYEFWEADGPFDDDDHLGTRVVTWTALSGSGYTFFNAGDAELRADRDL